LSEGEATAPARLQHALPPVARAGDSWRQRRRPLCIPPDVCEQIPETRKQLLLLNCLLKVSKVSQSGIRARSHAPGLAGQLRARGSTFLVPDCGLVVVEAVGDFEACLLEHSVHEHLLVELRAREGLHDLAML